MSTPSTQAWWIHPGPPVDDAPVVIVDPDDADPDRADHADPDPDPDRADPDPAVGTVPGVPTAPTVVLLTRRQRARTQTSQLRRVTRSLRSARSRARRRGRRTAQVAAAAALLAAVIGLAVVLRPEAPRVPPATAPHAVPIDPATITATASSTQSPDGAVTYSIANTLDGDPATAWNSNGKRHGSGPGIALTYTFTQPVELRDVTLRNGYQKIRPRPGKAPLDLYPLNERLRRVRVITDAGRWTWDLADTRSAQTFAGAAGRTGSVRLELVTTYPGSSYPDVALSEIAFAAAPGR